MRQCDGCTLCCTVMAVKELAKPQDTPCQHCTGKGCGVHSTPDQPQGCKEFQCLWLRELVPEEYKPDKVNVVMGHTGDGTRLQAFVPVSDPDAYRRGEFGAWLLGVADSGLDVIVVCGDNRKMITSRPETLNLLFGPKR